MRVLPVPFMASAKKRGLKGDTIQGLEVLGLGSIHGLCQKAKAERRHHSGFRSFGVLKNPKP